MLSQRSKHQLQCIALVGNNHFQNVIKWKTETFLRKWLSGLKRIRPSILEAAFINFCYNSIFLDLFWVILTLFISNGTPLTHGLPLAAPQSLTPETFLHQEVYPNKGRVPSPRAAPLACWVRLEATASSTVVQGHPSMMAVPKKQWHLVRSY